MAKQPMGVDSGVPQGIILKSIPGVSDKYVAGSDGRIYSYSNAPVNRKKPKPFPLSIVRNSKGYELVSIFDNNVKKSRAVHGLVLLAFHGPKPFKNACSRHLDGNQANNKPENLLWGTYAENEADKRRHGRNATGERHGAAKLTAEAVRIIRASIPFGLWNTRDAAVVFGVSPSRINAIARGKTWKGIE